MHWSATWLSVSLGCSLLISAAEDSVTMGGTSTTRVAGLAVADDVTPGWTEARLEARRRVVRIDDCNFM